MIFSKFVSSLERLSNIAIATLVNPLETWQTIATDWQEAIAPLEAIATESSVAPNPQAPMENGTALSVGGENRFHLGQSVRAV